MNHSNDNQYRAKALHSTHHQKTTIHSSKNNHSFIKSNQSLTCCHFFAPAPHTSPVLLMHLLHTQSPSYSINMLLQIHVKCNFKPMSTLTVLTSKGIRCSLRWRDRLTPPPLCIWCGICSQVCRSQGICHPLA